MKNPNPYTARDALFTARVDAWQPLPRGFLGAFGRDGAGILNGRERGFDAERRRIVFLAFESRYAPLGGLAAVMRQMPAHLKRAGEEALVFSPLYPNIPAFKEALDCGELELILPKQEFQSSSYKGVVSCYVNLDGPVPAYFLSVDGRFTAPLNPYSYLDANEILDDSLAFCAAVPFILSKLGVNRDILFHAHDWEAAPIALTSKIAVFCGMLENARTVLTLHNSFDSGIDVSRKRLFFGDVPGDTVLQCAIPLLNGPLTTVSAPFASELCAEALQRTVFTSHLQSLFSENPPIGIENGMFGKPYLRYTYAALSHARQGACGKILAEKARFRAELLALVNAASLREGAIGSLKDAVTDTGRPIFFMSGRLDLMQKGFDVIFHAIQNFPVGKVGLIFCPSSADSARSSKELAFFREIAKGREGDIVIWPFRISTDEYVSAVLGSSFLLMPSFYEPFGAATEGLMHGTPVVARATGGLTVQVRPPLSDGSIGAATGLLYREQLDGSGAEESCGWSDILNVPVTERINLPLYKSMASEAAGALSRAAEIFADGEAYGRMMVNGMDSLRAFSWGAAVEKYRRVYDAASRRGFFDE